MFIARSLWTGKANIADEMTKNCFNKLEPQKAAPFPIIREHLRTIVLDEEGVPNTVSKQRFRATVALREQCPKNADVEFI